MSNSNNKNDGIIFDPSGPFDDVYQQSFTFEQMEDHFFEVFPLLNRFTFKENEVVGEQTLSEYDEFLLSKGQIERKQIHHPIQVVIKRFMIDFDYINSLFDEIDSIHISDMLTESESVKYRFNGRFIEHAYINKRNKNFSVDGGVLMDKKNNQPLYLLNRDEIVIPKGIDDEHFGMPYHPRHHGKHFFSTKYNLSLNPNYFEREDGQIIHKKSGTIVYIPDDKKVYIWGTSSVHDSCFLNHTSLESVSICHEHGELFNYDSLIDALDAFEKDQSIYQREKPLVVFLPKKVEKGLVSSKRIKTRDFIRSHLIDKRIIIQFVDIDEPDTYID